MQTAIDIVGWVNVVLLVVLTAFTGHLLQANPIRSARLLFLAISAFTIGTVLAYLPLASGDGALVEAFTKARLLILFAFAWLVLRLVHEFRPFPHRTMRGFHVTWIIAAAWIVLAPVNIGDPTLDLDAPLPLTMIGAYLGWTIAAFSWCIGGYVDAGRAQPGAIRFRMQTMALAVAMMLSSYVLSFLAWGMASAPLSLAAAACVTGALLGYVGGVAAPALLRRRWRRDDENELARAIMALMSAQTRDDVVRSILPHTGRLVGARAVALVMPDGHIAQDAAVASEELEQLRHQLETGTSAPGAQATLVPFGGMQLAVVTSPATPLLGQPEFEMLRWIGSVVELAFDRVDQLERTRAVTARLREVDRFRREFLQIVTHDLRSPMAAVAGLADMLREHWRDLDDDARDRMLLNIGASTRRMSELVVDVLDVERIDAGELSYDLQPIDVVALVRAAVEELAILHPSRPIQLDLPDEPPALALADPRRIRQVLDNLIANARTHGGPEVHVTVRVRSRSDAVEVHVDDDGPGIRREDQTRIFRKFERAPGGDRDVTPGTGLGLFICRAMVEAQGGEIGVHSEPGRGASFRFTIPLVGVGPSRNGQRAESPATVPTQARPHA